MDQLASTYVKIIPLLAAVVPCIFAILVFEQRTRVHGGALLEFTFSDRSEVQIFVQVLSHILGFLQVYSLRGLLQLYTRSRVFDRAISLRQLSHWIALATGQINTSLPWRDVLIAIVLLVAGFVPGAVWAGAITPLVVLKENHDPGSIALPAFSNDTISNWNIEFELVGNDIFNHVQSCNSSGILTNCPVPALQGILLDTIGTAWAPNETQRKHAKVDSTGWVYNGRSFGAGSSVGRSQANLPASFGQYPSNAQALTYTEHSWLATVECKYNLSAAYSLEEVGLIIGPNYGTPVWGPTAVYGYIASGYLPNSFNEGLGQGVGENFTVLSSFDGGNSTLVLSARSIGGTNYISIATGPDVYEDFNSTQCEVFFAPYAFNVSVNNTAKTIQVLPVAEIDASDLLVPPLQVTINTIQSVNLLGRMSSSLYTSVLGDAFARNLATVTSNSTDNILLNSLEAAFAAVIDDILVAFGVSQIAMAHDTVDVPVYGISYQIQVGNHDIINATLALSLALAFIQISCLILSRLWKSLPTFNIFDTKSVIVAASAGSTGLADDLRDSACRKDYVPVSARHSPKVWGGNEDNIHILQLEINVSGCRAQCDMPRIEAVRSNRSNNTDRTDLDASKLSLIDHQGRATTLKPFLHSTDIELVSLDAN